MGYDSYSPDDNNQNQGPTWLKALQAGSAGLSGAARPTPWSQLGQNVGQLAGGAMRQHGLNSDIKKQQGTGTPPLGGQMGAPMPQQPMAPEPPTSHYPGSQMPPYMDGQQPMQDQSQNPSLGSPMADGQIVDKPTLAIIGEEEPEAVVPMSYRAGAKVRPSMAMQQPQGRTPYR